MELRNSASTGAMGSLLCKLGEFLRTEDDEAQAIRQLRDDVASIGLKLEELSEVHDPPLTVNYWMRDARELSYDMEDCVDLFVAVSHADSDASKTAAWTDEISGFRTRVEEVMDRYHRFNLECVLSSRPDLVASRRLQTAYEDVGTVAPIGMEGPKTELLRWLKPKDDDDGKDLQLKVVSILGVEGVGKSTLAQELWRMLGEEFECRAFVQASKKPNMRMILGSILLQVRPNQHPLEACRVPNLIRSITKQLQDKRYFIILDDLWAVSVWDTVSRAFPEGNCCSRIVTTTTIKDVALACCSYNPEHIFKMKSLSHDHSIGLFTRTVFGSGKECPQKFHDVSDEITGKCGGLPLAITCIATLVASQQETVHHWEYIQKFLRQNLRTKPTSVEILKQVLNLCYSSLPHCLKTCLLYLSVYPENYLILKEDLMKQWIAEGFVGEMKQMDIMAQLVASRRFDQLVSLGLIQRMDISCDKKGLSYVVHPTVFEFITCQSIEDNFITIIDYSQSTVALTEKVRRLSLHFGSATYATIPESIGPPQIRSLSFIGLLNCMPSLEDFKLVRVIILHVLVDSGDTRFSLTGIRGLLLLRYLQVRCNVTVELPDQIGCLKHLETLEIHERLAAVPSDIVNLPKLRHFWIRTGRKRYCHHKHLTPSCLPSVQSLSFDESRWESYALMIPRSPRWIGHFRFLCHLDVAVGEMQMYGVDVLAELWALKVLSLYVGTPTTAKAIHLKRGAFPAVNYFRYMCGGVMLLTFDKEAMPNLWKLSIGFNAHRGVKYGHMLAGIQHLLNLQEISACVGAAFGAEESDRRAAESAFQDAISKHPCLPSFKVKRFDGEYDPLEKKNWVQDMELSNEQHDVVKIQHEARSKDLSNDQPRVLGKMPWEDDLSSDQPAGDLGNMPGEYMDKYDAYTRVMMLASKRAVVVFTLSSYSSMCNAVTRLMADLGVKALVHELDRDPRGKEMERTLRKKLGRDGGPSFPIVFIGGMLVGGMNRIMSLHLDGKLVPMLRNTALWSVETVAQA